MLDDFRTSQPRCYAAPRIGLVSNLTGRLFGAADEIGAAYWRRHARESVQFVAGIETLYAEGVRLFVEVGPRPTLAGIGKGVLPESAAVWLPSLRKGQDEWRQMFTSLAMLHLHGVRVDWAGFDREYPRRRVPLPTYPFQRTPFWTARSVAPAPRAQSKTFLHPLLHRRIPMPIRERVFEVAITPDSPSFLAGHRVQGAIVLSATAYLEMLLAAATEVYGPGPHQLEAVRFEEALVLSDGREQTVQIVLTPELTLEDGEMRFEVCRRDDGHEGTDEADVSWRRLASGKLRSGASLQMETVALGTSGASGNVSIDAFWPSRQTGLSMAPIFGLRRLHRGTAQALGSVNCRVVGRESHRILSSGLARRGLQVWRPASRTIPEDDSHAGGDRAVCLLGQLGTHVWSYATAVGRGGCRRHGDMPLDGNGRSRPCAGLRQQAQRAATPAVSRGRGSFYGSWRAPGS